jgi:5-methylcytosine-specific restriction endonuclease McrA
MNTERTPAETKHAKKLAKDARYRERHRAERSADQRAYYAAHRDERDAAVRAWQSTRPWSYIAIKFANSSNARARRLGATGKLYGREVKLIVGPCRYCGGAQARWDHLIPLARGGTNTIDNLVPCCIACNKTKGNRTPDQWRGHGA